jgi:hypothetical protein
MLVNLSRPEDHLAFERAHPGVTSKDLMGYIEDATQAGELDRFLTDGRVDSWRLLDWANSRGDVSAPDVRAEAPHMPTHFADFDPRERDAARHMDSKPPMRPMEYR